MSDRHHTTVDKPRAGHTPDRPLGAAERSSRKLLTFGVIVLALSMLVASHTPFTHALGQLSPRKAPQLTVAQQGDPITAATVYLPHLIASGLEDAKPAIQLDLEWQFGSPVQSVTIAGRYGYVGRGRQLVVLDLSDPRNPVAIGESEALAGPIFDIVYADDHVFLTTGRSFHVLDVSIPSNPREIAAIDDVEAALKVALLNDHAFVTSGANRLWVYDISNPAAPWLAQTLEIDSLDVTVSGHHVFVANPWAAEEKGNLQVFDGTDPTNLLEVGAVAIPHALGVEVSDGIAYVLGYRDVVVVDIANLAEPRAIGDFTGDWHHGSDNPSFAVSGGLAFLPGGDLQIVDVSNPAGSRRVEGRTFRTPGQVTDVTVIGPHVFVADNGGGLRILDIGEPSSVSEVGVYDSAGIVFDVVAENETAFVAAGDAGLRVLDTSNPNEPRQLTVVDTPGQAVDIALTRGHAYIADDSGGLRIVDVTTPAEAAEVGFVPSSEPVRQVVIEGNLAFINPESGLVIFDLTDPALPSEIGSFATAEGIIAVQDGHLFLAERKELVVIDVHDPTSPAVAGRVSTTESPYGAIPKAIAIADKYVFLAPGGEGVRAFDVSVPQSPRQAAHFRTHAARTMTSRSPLVFTGIGRVIRVFDGSLPNVPGPIAQIHLVPNHLGDTALSAHGDHLFRLGNAYGVIAYRISRP